MQIYADVTGRQFRLSGSDQTPALGSAMYGAVAAGAAAGGYATIEDAAGRWPASRTRLRARSRRNQPVYDACTASTSASTTTSAGARTTS